MRAFLAALALLVAAPAWPLTVMPPRSQAVFTLQAAPGDHVLALEGRFVAELEGGAPAAIRLTLNGEVLGGLVHGWEQVLPIEYIYSTSAPYGPWPPAGRYSVANRAYLFLEDTDYTPGNGPFPPAPDGEYPVWGCPPLLQLDLAQRLRPGANELVITNGADKPFEIRRLACLAQAEERELPLPARVGWPALYWSPILRGRYHAALQRADFTGEARAHVVAALGIAEFLRSGGQRNRAVSLLRQALAAGVEFDLRTEAAYRLAAERWRRGEWPEPGDSALVRAAAAPHPLPKGEGRGEGLPDPAAPDPWAGMTRALLAVLAGQPEQAGRPVITPVTTDRVRVDGVLDEPCWRQARQWPVQAPMAGMAGPNYHTQARFAVLPGGLAMAVESDLPENVRWVTGLGRDEWAWLDHCVELFIATPELNDYREFNATPLGGQFDTDNHWLRIMDFSWNGRWQVASRLQPGHFTMEYLVPWEDLPEQRSPSPQPSPLGRGGETQPALRPRAVYIISVIRNAQDDVRGERVRTLAALTPYTKAEPHRMMEGAVLRLPSPQGGEGSGEE